METNQRARRGKARARLKMKLRELAAVVFFSTAVITLSYSRGETVILYFLPLLLPSTEPDVPSLACFFQCVCVCRGGTFKEGSLTHFLRPCLPGAKETSLQVSPPRAAAAEAAHCPRQQCGSSPALGAPTHTDLIRAV